MRQGTVVYFQCNDWSPSPKEAENFIYNYLEGYHDSIDNPNAVLKTQEEVDTWYKENDLCINTEIYDMSLHFWVTTTKEWLEDNFPELLPYASEEPKDYMFKGDKKYFLKYEEENVGEWMISDQEPWSKPSFEKDKHRLINEK